MNDLININISTLHRGEAGAGARAALPQTDNAGLRLRKKRGRGMERGGINGGWREEGGEKGGGGLYEICMSEDGFIMRVLKEF